MDASIIARRRARPSNRVRTGLKESAGWTNEERELSAVECGWRGRWTKRVERIPTKPTGQTKHAGMCSFSFSTQGETLDRARNWVIIIVATEEQLFSPLGRGIPTVLRGLRQTEADWERDENCLFHWKNNARIKKENGTCLSPKLSIIIGSIFVISLKAAQRLKKEGNSKNLSLKASNNADPSQKVV